MPLTLDIACMNPVAEACVRQDEASADRTLSDRVNIMELKNIPVTDGARVLHEAELDIVVAGQAWISPMAIHGFNPQPDPPAFGPLIAGLASHA